LPRDAALQLTEPAHKPSPRFVHGRCKIAKEKQPARLQDPPRFAQGARFVPASEVMKHHRAEHDVRELALDWDRVDRRPQETPAGNAPPRGRQHSFVDVHTREHEIASLLGDPRKHSSWTAP
jgi:hypothetical protein